MGESTHVKFLISIYCDGILLKIAARIDRDLLTGNCANFYMEPENRVKIRNLLPAGLREAGPIVEIVELFDIVNVG